MPPPKINPLSTLKQALRSNTNNNLQASPALGENKLDPLNLKVECRLQSPPSSQRSLESTSRLHDIISGLQAEMAPPAEIAPPAVPKLSFIGGEELKKFIGNKTPYDTSFSPGPSIEEFTEAFKSFCDRHELTTDNDRIASIRMMIHPSMGDARFVLSSLLDSNINANITFQEVLDYLNRAYKTTSSINFYRASQNFLQLCKPKLAVENDFLKLRGMEIAARELLDAFSKREAYANCGKSPEEKIVELLSFIAFSAYTGEKISNKITKGSVTSRELLVRTKEEIRLLDLKDRSSLKDENVFYSEPKQPQQSGFKRSFGKNQGQYGNTKSNSGRNHFNNTNNSNRNVICHKCGHPSHSAKDCKTQIELFCGKCLKGGHVSSVCFSKQSLFRDPK